MNMIRWSPVALATALLAPASAQDAASTRGGLLQRADATAQVRFVGSTYEGELRAARFVTLRTIRGSAPSDPFTLTEPDGRACGRALAGLIPGASYVVFLDIRGDHHDPCLASSSSRALPLATPGLLQHVLELADTPETAWTETFAAALDSIDPRVRADAALDLARRPDLESATTNATARILDALARGLQEEEAPHTALIQATLRTRAPGSAAMLVRHYVVARSPWLDRALLVALVRYPATDVAACLPFHAHRGIRTAEIAARLDARAGTPILAGIAAGNIDPEARALAVRALRARGVRSEDLSMLGVQPADVQSAALPDPRSRPRFRSINPALAAPGAPR
ncbi:MAG: hypothetical protein ACO4CZ_02720 [Planctomycetota bacterium]